MISGSIKKNKKIKTEDLNMFKLNINVSDILLTPLACSSLVNEILKGILYQKCQIPYPYDWMKTMVTRKRQKSEIDVKKFNNIKATNHFLLVSSVLDKLETFMQAIEHEFSQCKTNIQEVFIVLGTTPHTANEIISVSFTLVDGHNEKNHISQLNKYRQKILRQVIIIEIKDVTNTLGTFVESAF